MSVFVKSALRKIKTGDGKEDKILLDMVITCLWSNDPDDSEKLSAYEQKLANKRRMSPFEKYIIEWYGQSGLFSRRHWGATYKSIAGVSATTNMVEVSNSFLKHYNVSSKHFGIVKGCCAILDYFRRRNRFNLEKLMNKKSMEDLPFYLPGVNSIPKYMHSFFKNLDFSFNLVQKLPDLAVFSDTATVTLHAPFIHPSKFNQKLMTNTENFVKNHVENFVQKFASIFDHF